jgi:uncharacterized glyoxalase superfamily protein PhnB
MPKVNPIPEGFHTLTPHIIVKGAAKAIDFYTKALGAEEVCRMSGPGGALIHAEMQIGSSRLMLAEENPQWHCFGPGDSSPVTLHLYVADCDAVYARATGAGAQPVMPPEDMFWGDRFSKIRDPFGHVWSIATHVSDPTPEEMQQAMAAMCGG